MKLNMTPRIIADVSVHEVLRKTAIVVNDLSDTVQNKLRESVSVKDFGAVGDGVTSDQTAINAAVAACKLSGANLYWPDGTYLTTASISDLHNVKHSGPGVIKRGTTLFYVQPSGSQTNTIYLATTGSNTDDGLTASQPVATFQQAFDVLTSYGPYLDGIWNIVAAAGTYTSPGAIPTLQDIMSVDRVVIKGPTAGHPNVPTCIVSGGSSGANYEHGMFIKGIGLSVTVQDIKFQNFIGDPAGNSRGGLVFDDGCDAYTNNVHAYNCTWFGVYYSRRTSGRHEGGIIDTCRDGVLTDGAKCTVGYGASSLSDGTIVQNCTQSGVHWSRNTDGHTDYVTFQDNAIGLNVNTNSRTDSVGCDFKRNAVAVKTSNSGYFGDNPYTPCNFNTGTSDANTINVDYHANSGESTEGEDGNDEIRVAYDRTYRTATGTTPTVLTTPYTIKAGRLIGVGKSCRVEVYGIYTVTAGSTLTVTFGGVSLTLAVSGAVTNSVFRLSAMLHDVGGGYRAFGSLTHNLSAGRHGSAVGFVNTSDQAITIGCTLAGGADTIGIYRTDVYLTG
jgi:hypothetical protein